MSTVKISREFLSERLFAGYPYSVIIKNATFDPQRMELTIEIEGYEIPEGEVRCVMTSPVKETLKFVSDK